MVEAKQQAQHRGIELTGVQLTDVKAMLGCTGQTRFLLGCISQLQDSTYYLEDMTGSLQLDLANCQTSSGLYTGAPSWFSHNLPVQTKPKLMRGPCLTLVSILQDFCAS